MDILNLKYLRKYLRVEKKQTRPIDVAAQNYVGVAKASQSENVTLKN